MKKPRFDRQADRHSASVSLPPQRLLEMQAAWLSGVRSRLLRRVQVAARRSILDLGAGRGAVTSELVRRGGGRVIAFDLQYKAMSDEAGGFRDAPCVCGDAARLPFADKQFDLVYCQYALLWMDPDPVLAEIRRVLAAGGVLIALEPDFAGMIESPGTIATRPLWISGLERAGADPRIGRKLPHKLASLGFDVRVDLVPELQPAQSDRFELLRGLPLSVEERASLDEIERQDGKLKGLWCRVVHLPIFLITATKRSSND